ncbi:winged helix-turn-helix domain-containing protein [uncultured Methanobrevibacter sp.]|uniref:helix-turn-helix transcriptional regulator n=1 Tax=uncultured Methanobrevibacter sp. TaxID=253161 RepID=UPI0025EA4123|nr:transcriptional regulator FilR1 domain-containing protein [uncultured Methanobrevibacter sp.]
MVENKNYLESYKSISEELKHLTNSLSRIKILATLYECPKTMKDLTQDTGLSYSSVSSNMHKLELDNYVYRESSKYYLSNCMKLKIENILELNEIIHTLNKFFNILDKHLVEMIPNDSIAELYLLGQATLIESNDIDAYRTYNYIENILQQANSVRCILPFYYEKFNKQLDNLVEGDKYVEAIVYKNIFHIFKEDSNIENLSSFNEENNFLLILTDSVMILGLFKEDGFFDQNRLLVSKNKDSIKWAENLFENFKNKNK